MGSIISLKIGRNQYDISESDRFMDNSSCIQLLTQSKEKCVWGGRADPVLSKRAIKEISTLEKLHHEHSFGEKVQIFSLTNKQE